MMSKLIGARECLDDVLEVDWGVAGKAQLYVGMWPRTNRRYDAAHRSHGIPLKRHMCNIFQCSFYRIEEPFPPRCCTVLVAPKLKPEERTDSTQALQHHRNNRN